MVRKYFLLSLVLIILASFSPQYANAATQYDAVKDFSNSNPNGVWSYLWAAQSTWTTLPTFTDECFSSATQLEKAQTGQETCWSNGSLVPNQAVIAAGASTGADTVIVPANHLRLDPQSGSVAVRFTAPASGSYTISGDFLGIDKMQLGHFVTVLKNGQSILPNSGISFYSQSVPFNFNSLSLAADDTLDFVVLTGAGGDCSFCYLSTGLSVSIDADIPTQALTVSVAGDGTVTSTPSGISCNPTNPTTCSTSFPKDTNITLIASPASGASFAGWTGAACAGAGTGSCQLLLSQDATVAATFTRPLSSGNSCNGYFAGNFGGNLTISAGQQCTFVGASDIRGNVTLGAGSFRLLGGKVDGNVNQNGGSLSLGSDAAVGGNLQISGASTFTLAPGAAIGGNLQIQNLATGQAQSMACGTRVGGNLQVQHAASAVTIGNNTKSCAGNSVSGNLQADNNSAALAIDYNKVIGNLQVNNNTGGVDVSGNKVRKNLQCQGNNPAPQSVTGNIVDGQAQGQCAPFP